MGFLKSRIYMVYLFITNFFPLVKVLLIKRPDFLVIHLLTSLPLIILSFFDLKTKFILRISGLPKLNFMRKMLWKIVSKKIHLITCPSQETLNDIKELEIFDEKKIVLLFDPIIDISFIQKQKKKINKSIKEKNFFLNIGRLTRQKNQKILIELFKDQVERKKDLILYIIGEGEEKKNLKKIISKYKLEKNVFLLGHKKNIYEYLLNAKALISCSLWEDPGAVMIEAAFSNTLVLSSNCKNGPKEFLMNAQAGYLFENDNLDSLRSEFIRLNQDKKSTQKSKLFLAKTNSKNYTLFNHYKIFNNYLKT